MSRPWIAAALAASLIAFASAYLVVSSHAIRSTGSELPDQPVRLTAAAAPRSWQSAKVPGSPAVLAHPGGWKAIDGDPGTASAALPAGRRIIGYLNATPRSGAETPANWLSFRPAHNREEGDGDVTPLAGSRDLRFRTGRGSCLIDGYTTATGDRYRELACIVAGRKATTVVVGSALAQRWSRLAPVLRRAVSSFTT